MNIEIWIIQLIHACLCCFNKSDSLMVGNAGNEHNFLRFSALHFSYYINQAQILQHSSRKTDPYFHFRFFLVVPRQNENAKPNCATKEKILFVLETSAIVQKFATFRFHFLNLTNSRNSESSHGANFFTQKSALVTLGMSHTTLLR